MSCFFPHDFKSPVSSVLQGTLVLLQQVLGWSLAGRQIGMVRQAGGLAGIPLLLCGSKAGGLDLAHAGMVVPTAVCLPCSCTAAVVPNCPAYHAVSPPCRTLVRTNLQTVLAQPRCTITLALSSKHFFFQIYRMNKFLQENLLPLHKQETLDTS